VGKGAFGKVRIVERKDSGLTFALKYIRKDEGMSAGCPFREVLLIAMQLSGPKAFATSFESGGCSNI
jgi:hypothetical protein